MSIASKLNKSDSIRARKGLKRVLLSLTLALFVVAPIALQHLFGLGISPVLSGSMVPFAQPGDIFISVERSASQLAVGDIVTLQSAGSNALYAHRIIEIREQSGDIRRIVTQGDANPTAEQDPFMVTSKSQIPVTVLRVKWVGHLLVFLASAQGRQAALSLIVIANLLMLLLSLFKKSPKNVASQGEGIYRDLYSEAHWQLQTIREK